MNFVLKVMRDPIWSMLSVLVAILTIFVTTSQTTLNRKELTVVFDHQSKLANVLLPSDRFKLFLEGTTYDFERTTVDHYLLTNESSGTVRPIDFKSPLTIQPNAGTKQIILVESCSKQLQACYGDSSSTPTGGAYAPTSWKQVGDSWEADNPLLNEGERACVLVVSILKDVVKTDELIPQTWSARIEGYRLKLYNSPQEYFASKEKRLIDYMWTAVVLQGSGVYWFVLLLAVLLFVNLSIAGTGSWLAVNTKIGVLKCVLLALLCTCTSEILVDIFINRRGHVFNSGLHPVVWPLLAVHSLLVVYLARRAFTIRQTRSAS